ARAGRAPMDFRATLAEDSADLPPDQQALPAAPLLRLRLGRMAVKCPPPADLWAAMSRACAGYAEDPRGRRVCSSLSVGLGRSLLGAGCPLLARTILEAAVDLAPRNP